AVHPHEGPVALVRLDRNHRLVPTGMSGPWPSALRFRPGGKRLLLACGDGSVQEADVAGGKLGTLVPAPGLPAPPVLETNAFAPPFPAGKLAAFARGRVVRIWDLEGGKARPCFDDHRDGTYTEAVPCPRGLLVATGSVTELRVWELRTGRLLLRIPGKGF